MAPVVAMEQKPPTLPEPGRDPVGRSAGRHSCVLLAGQPQLLLSSDTQHGLEHMALSFTSEGRVGSQIVPGDANLGRIVISLLDTTENV